MPVAMVMTSEDLGKSSDKNHEKMVSFIPLSFLNVVFFDSIVSVLRKHIASLTKIMPAVCHSDLV